MDPKVCGKLLTHHRRGYGVDIEALCDWFPLRQIAGKGPKMGSHGYRRLRRWKVVLWLSLMFLGYKSIYRRKKYVGGAPWGPRGWGARPPSSLSPCRVPDFNSKSSGLLSFQERSSRRFHSVCILFGFPFLQKHWNRQKNRNWQWAFG